MLFEQTRLHELEKTAIRAGLWRRDVQPLLLHGLSEEYQAHLPDGGSGYGSLAHTLRYMNTTPLLGDGITCPLLVWLRNAAHHLAPAEAAIAFEKWIRACTEAVEAIAVETTRSHFVVVPRDARLEAAERSLSDLESSAAPAEVVAVAREGVLSLRRAEREGPVLAAKQWLGERFLLLERIGEGGFASVWLAWDRENDAQVALKALHPRRAQNRTHRERFLRGARKMAGLDHPGIARIIEPHCTESGLFYFVMAYYAGGDLQAAVLGGDIPPEDGLAIVLQVADALGSAHESGCVHRDVKPSNILLAADGAPRLADFDLVWAADTTGGTDGGLGTPIFAAPELGVRSETADPSVDVYGLAMTMAFVLHAEPLPIAWLRHHDRFLRQLNCNEGIRRVLAKATATIPSHRYASVAAFAEALEHAAKRPRMVSPPPVAVAVEHPIAVADEAPQAEAPQAEAPQAEAPQVEAPQAEAPQAEAPQVEAPRRSPRWGVGSGSLGGAPPSADPYVRAVELRTEYRQHEELVRRFGILFLVFGTMIAIGLVAGGARPFEASLVPASALLSGVIGAGLGRLSPWARWPAIIGSAALLFWYPIGTVLGAFVLYLTLSPKGAFVLTADYREIVERTPDVSHEGGLALGCLTLIIAGGLTFAGVLVYAALTL